MLLNSPSPAGFGLRLLPLASVASCKDGLPHFCGVNSGGTITAPINCAWLWFMPLLPVKSTARVTVSP